MYLNPHTLFLYAFFPMLLIFYPKRVSCIGGCDDCFESLIRHYNSDQKSKLTIEQCIYKTDSLALKKELVFPNPHPDSKEYETFGFRKFGEKCNYVKERSFYSDMHAIIFRKAEDFPEYAEKIKNPALAHLEPSDRMRFLMWSETWKNYSEDPVASKQICNPRWFLECQESRGNLDQDECGCMRTGLKTLGISLIQELVNDQTCLQNGTCPEDAHLPGTRCVAKDSPERNDPDAKRITYRFNVCEFILPPFGICSVNCNHDSDCMVLPLLPDTLKVNKKFESKRVCCYKDSDQCKDQIMTSLNSNLKPRAWALLITFGTIWLWLYE